MRAKKSPRSDRRLSDADRAELLRRVSAIPRGTTRYTVEVAELEAFYRSLRIPSWAPGKGIVAFRLLDLPGDELDPVEARRIVADATSDLTSLANCEDWGPDPSRRHAEWISLDSFDNALSSGNGNGHVRFTPRAVGK